MISVCVLSFNRLEFLKQSLASMVATATEPLEIIVHDDGSDVGVVRWLTEAVTRGEISHLILNPIGHNEGQGTALNRMFNMASGDIIIKADQDLIYQPGWTKAIREVLAHNRERAARQDLDRIGCLGLFKYHVDPVDWRKMRIQVCTDGLVQWEECKDFCGSLLAIPREAWDTFGPFDEHSDAFAEDFTFKMKVAETEGWCLALTVEDYVQNIGFGEGPSTVVVRDEKNELTSRAIHHGPLLIYPPQGG